jgi:hypothetical protein
VTTPGTTAAIAAEVTTPDVALAEGLEAVAALRDDVMGAIAHLAGTWDSPDGDDRVLRMTGRPDLTGRHEAAAA